MLNASIVLSYINTDPALACHPPRANTLPLGAPTPSCAPSRLQSIADPNLLLTSPCIVFARL